jgi:uncharacterized membrane protein
MALFLLPMIGAPLCNLLQPGLFAGLVLAARDQQNGLPVRPAHLFAGFRANGRPLVTLGSTALIAEIVILYLLTLLGMPSLTARADGLPDISAWQAAMVGHEWIAIVGLVLIFLLKGLFWFAAPVLALNPMMASAGLRWSAYAFIANFLPLAVLCVAMTALFVLAAVPLMLGLPLWLPLYALVHYTSYRATFKTENGESK